MEDFKLKSKVLTLTYLEFALLCLYKGVMKLEGWLWLCFTFMGVICCIATTTLLVSIIRECFDKRDVANKLAEILFEVKMFVLFIDLCIVSLLSGGIFIKIIETIIENLML